MELTNTLDERLREKLPEDLSDYFASTVGRPSFYSHDRFPKIAELAANWQVIREEFLALDAPILEINRAGRSIAGVVEDLTQHMQQGGQYGWLKGWGDGMEVMTTWVQYGLMAYDKPIPFAVPHMPRTIELLQKVGDVKLCALLRMEPNVFLGRHAHVGAWEEGLLHAQLTLDAPSSRNYCYMNVNGEFNQSTNGNLVIFDGSLDHFALNASEVARTIMYLEFQRERHMLPAS
jgi:beta-hydroxylase